MTLHKDVSSYISYPSYPDKVHKLARQIAIATGEISDFSACPIFVNGFLCGYTNELTALDYQKRFSANSFRSPYVLKPNWMRGWHQGQRMAGYE